MKGTNGMEVSKKEGCGVTVLGLAQRNTYIIRHKTGEVGECSEVKSSGVCIQGRRCLREDCKGALGGTALQCGEPEKCLRGGVCDK